MSDMIWLTMESVDPAIVVRDSGDLIILLGNAIKIKKNNIKKIRITEELIEDYGKISASGNMILDIKKGKK